MAKKCMQYREERRKYDVRVRNRCKKCGRPRAYIRRFGFVPYLFPRVGKQGTNPWRCQV
jgi:small subunit ribosomal protein S14